MRSLLRLAGTDTCCEPAAVSALFAPGCPRRVTPNLQIAGSSLGRGDLLGH